jgi:hypothetical protein
MLPLIGLNQWSFGSTTDNFVNSYISEDNQHIIVEMRGNITTIISNHTNYRFGFNKEGHNFVVFEIPEFYRKDVAKFREGKYSEISEQGKNLIRKKAGLKYKIPKMGGGVETAVELLALDKDPDLRKHLEEKLSNQGSYVKIDPDAELASIPGEDNFYQLELTHA